MMMGLMGLSLFGWLGIAVGRESSSRSRVARERSLTMYHLDMTL